MLLASTHVDVLLALSVARIHKYLRFFALVTALR